MGGGSTKKCNHDCDYLEILTIEEVKDFVAINFNEYFKCIREDQNLK